MQVAPNKLTSDTSGRQLRARAVKHTKGMSGADYTIQPKTSAMFDEEEHQEQHSPLLTDHSPVHEQSPSQLHTRNNSHNGSTSSKVHYTSSTHTSPVRHRLNSSVSEENEFISTEERTETYIERVTIFPEQLNSPVDDDSGVSELGGEDHPLSGDVPPRHRKTGKETVCSILTQVAIPFVIAGFGMMAAGLLLDAVQHWEVYREINEIFILVPALLGLKGNLEMTLASRLSTAANVGQLDSWANRWRLTWGNMALIQAQALVVAGLATIFSIVMGRDLIPAHELLMGASAMGAACIASAVLGSIMIGVIFLSHYAKINPDNVATPIAAALGDLVTLGLLSLLAQGIYDIGRTTVKPVEEQLGSGLLNFTATNSTLDPGPTITVSSIVLACLMVLIPLWMVLAYKNPTTKGVLFYGWIPVICAMIISSAGGWVLSFAVNKWKGIAVYSPIINGVGGNLVAVQASRISTSLHQSSSPGSPMTDPELKYRGPLRTFFSKNNPHARTAKILVGLVMPGSLIFLGVIYLVGAGHTTQSLLFVIGYIICALIQVILLLLMADWGVHLIWRLGFDPDNIAIPFLTAMGDLLGTGLLTLGFWLMWLVGDKDDDVGD